MVSINTNLSSLLVQENLLKSTNALNLTMERMTTGFKINKASDNAANYAITQDLSSKMSSLLVAEENANLGLDMVNTLSSGLELISRQASRLRDIAEKAQNGTNGEKTIRAINTEAQSIIDEILRIISENDYEEISMFSSSDEDEDASNIISFQVGINNTDNSKIEFDGYFSVADILDLAEIGLENSDSLSRIDNFIDRLNAKQIEYGSIENRLTSVIESISVKYENLLSSRSTLRDADVGELSSEYIRQQILQQAAATLLSTANQTPQIALILI